MIPVELFVHMIQPFLELTDVISLSEVSQGMNAYFNQSLMWKKYHMEVVSELRYDKVLKKLETHKNSYIPHRYADPSDEWSEMDIPRYFVKFKNESTIPYSLYHKCSQISSDSVWEGLHTGKYEYVKDIQPDKSTKICSVGGSKWMCLPTKEWLSKNFVEGIGHLVTIPTKNGQNPMHGLGVNWCDYTHTIKEKDFKPMKELSKKYRDHKSEFIKRKIDPSELFTLSISNEKRMYEQQLELDALYRQVRLLEGNMKVYKRRHYVYQKMKKMFMKFKPHHDISILWKQDEQ